MAQFRNIDDTICAIATPPGFGGISVVRVSGMNAIALTRKFCSFLPENLESHRVYYGLFKNQKYDVDEVLVTFFKKGKSFTGDDTCEISCHGSPSVTKEILKEIIGAGARLAERGEFTYRAFMCGRIDLIQAESILGLIQSESEKAYQMSLRQLKGELSQQIGKLESRVTFILANLEASIDFINEGLDVLDLNKVKAELQAIREEVTSLAATYNEAKYLNEGVKVSLVGEPNVGKSSLFNRLVGHNKALVSDLPGTTRDVVEGSRVVNGVKVTFFDTAGVHETNDCIEKLGIEKTYGEISESDFIFYVVDKSSDPKINLELLKSITNKTIIFLANKSDLSKDEAFDGNLKNQIFELTGRKEIEILSVSAATADGLENVVAWIAQKLERTFLENSNVIVKARHHELLKKIESSLDETLVNLESNSPDIVSFSLKEAFQGFQELLGRKVDDQIMDRVFKEFCIGK